VQWQTDVVVSLMRLTRAGANAKTNLTEALAILRHLEAAGSLPPDKISWIVVVQAGLKNAR